MVVPAPVEVVASWREGRRGWATAALSVRDRTILALTAGKLTGRRDDMVEAARALRASTEEVIVGGRVFLVGEARGEPVLGSLISGVGLWQGEGRVDVVRLDRDGRLVILGALRP